MKNKRELQFTSCYHIYKSLSQVKTHRNGVYAKLKREMERNENILAQKWPRCLSSLEEILNLNDVVKNFRKL